MTSPGSDVLVKFGPRPIATRAALVVSNIFHPQYRQAWTELAEMDLARMVANLGWRTFLREPNCGQKSVAILESWIKSHGCDWLDPPPRNSAIQELREAARGFLEFQSKKNKQRLRDALDRSNPKRE
jgi:hypothetical protein